MAAQTEDAGLKADFERLASALKSAESAVIEELISVQGTPADIGAYYRPDAEKAQKIMRPSATLNKILSQ